MIMSFEEQSARIERLIGMIERTDIGTAEELAQKLGVSRRTVFNDIEFLKGKGNAIIFCHESKSFKFSVENRLFFVQSK